jgi:hypothetical protein
VLALVAAIALTIAIMVATAGGSGQTTTGGAGNRSRSPATRDPRPRRSWFPEGRPQGTRCPDPIRPYDAPAPSTGAGVLA